MGGATLADSSDRRPSHRSLVAATLLGPLAGMRWDPHALPIREQREKAVLYTVTSVLAAAAEVWQQGRVIRPRDGAPILVGFTPRRAVTLLDLTADCDWALRNGGSATLPFAPAATCQAWASEILASQPDLDGLLVPSTVGGGLNVVLYPHAADAVPSDAPDLVVSAADPAALALWDVVGTELGYRVI